jgi:hypothetical protein
LSKEGLVVFQPELQEPRIPYPQPPRVSDPIDLRFRHLLDNIRVLKKTFEFLDLILIALEKTHDAQLREVLLAGMRLKSNEIDELWRTVAYGLADLGDQKLASVLIDFFRLTTDVKFPLLKDRVWIWIEGFKQKAEITKPAERAPLKVEKPQEGIMTSPETGIPSCPECGMPLTPFSKKIKPNLVYFSCENPACDVRWVRFLIPSMSGLQYQVFHLQVGEKKGGE